jgi:formylmethanofuran dehydrogenase subunit E
MYTFVEVKLLFTEYTQQVIQEFLNHYKAKSQPSYIGIINLIMSTLKKDDVKKLTFDDFMNLRREFENPIKKISKDRYRESFFRYLYAFNILDDSRGFQKVFVKSQSIKHFNKMLKEEESNKVNYKPALTLKQLEKIETIVSKDYSDFNMSRIAFCWYMLFSTDVMIDELRNELDCNGYDDGQITSELGSTFDVSVKYEPMLRHFGSRANHTGFGSLSDYINRLGNMVGVENLTPQDIKSARKQNMLICSNCGERHPNIMSKWEVIDNRIVCINCSEEIKKNSNCEVEQFKNVTVEAFDEVENAGLSSIVNTFDELHKRAIREIDYLKIHKFQIEIGKLGEAFVYDLERAKLKDTSYIDDIDNTKALDHRNGYDILSFTTKGKKLYIEVKTTTGDEMDFYITKTEIDTYKRFRDEGEKYVIYRVSNILAKDKKDIKWEVIEDILENPEYKLEEWQWKVKKEL